MLKPDRQVSAHIPSPEAHVQVPKKILQRRVVQRAGKSLAKVPVQWSNNALDLTTWEDLYFVKQLFPRAPAWGQAVTQQGGIVSDLDAEREMKKDSNSKPIHKSRLPARLVGREWSMGCTSS